MEFQKYNSIDNATEKNIAYLMDYAPQDTAFVALEKIDGANFSVYVDRDKVEFARRKAVLAEDESFNNFQSISLRLENHAFSLMRDVAKDYRPDEPLEIRIYGELCGGSLEGYTSSMKSVRNYVQYSPEREFLVFDIMVNGKYLSHAEATYLALSNGFKTVPVLGQGTLADCLAVANDSRSIVSTILGYGGGPEENTMEGTIIKPMHTVLINQKGHRFILKNKGPKFSEKKAVDFTKATKGMDALEKVMYDDFCTFLNDNRLAAVLSKELDLEQKDFGQAVKLLVSDAKDDYYATFDNQQEAMEEFLAYPKMMKNVSKFASVIVRKHWVETFG